MAAYRWLACLLLLAPGSVTAAPPTCTDERLVIELVAQEPEIVTPTGMAVDEQGRLWVIENNTHERPANYKGFASDRIRVFEDFDSTGRPRRIRTFAEGFRNSMNLTLGKDGAVYLATRSAIYRLQDTKNAGVADDRQVIVKLETTATYPHNGLSGFAWDAQGNLFFSLGENYGMAYKLIGSDGTTLQGGGEGGSIYQCRPDGLGLVRIATGFWNPFHLTIDAFGRLFAVDNDPDSRGPCRLVHVIPGGDYGYRFRYGRKGLHPFIAWNGELPGTLPMVAGTGEAPSGIVAYESTGLPADYRGQLLGTSWGDHLVERFTLTPRGASFTSHSQALVRGGDDFRPVAIVTAPDGTLYLSDWVDKSYPVHGKGRLWRIRMKQPPEMDALRASAVAALDVAKLAPLLGHPRQEIRRAAGAALAPKGAAGKEVLAAVLQGKADARAKMEALWTAANMEPEPATDLLTRALADDVPEVRAEAAHLVGHFLPAQPDKRQEARLLDLATHDPALAVRLQALLQLRTPASLKAVLPVLADRDPFLAGAALDVLGRPGNSSLLLPALGSANASLRLGIEMALRRTGDPEGKAALAQFLDDPDPNVRRAAIQWVGEERLQDLAPRLQTAASRPPVTRDLFEALLATTALLDKNRKPGEDWSGEEYIARVVPDASQPAVFRAMALRMLRPDHPVLGVAVLRSFLNGPDANLRREAVRTLIFRPEEPAQELLRALAGNQNADPTLRAEAILGLAHSVPTSGETRRLLTTLLAEAPFRRDVLRSLRGAADIPDVRQSLLTLWENSALSPDERRELAEQLALILRPSKNPEAEKILKEVAPLIPLPPKSDADWKTALAGRGDPAAGERVFFHPRGPRCYACHRVDGRGGAIGPDLSNIGLAANRDKLIESILTPNKEIAPAYVSWFIVTLDGKVRTGVIVDEGPNSTITVADAQAHLEVIPRTHIEQRSALATSIMPDNLPTLLTRREFLDLLAFLEERR